ncbi:MAG: PIN domain-containing protein [Actinomycetota bacterium]|nr:PIN domain-containing protein [Actinomycetota bacterium]MDQ3720698.1 PIN domain-containing protein [Actinomycetota bacterium]
MLLLDMSAYARLGHPALSAERRDELHRAATERRLGTCLPFLLEVGYSTRSAPDHRELLEELSGLPSFPIDAEAERRALDAQQQLARVANHRLPPADLIIAAVADRHECGVLHYDAHYDTIAQMTDLRFEAVWLAGPGSL